MPSYWRWSGSLSYQLSQWFSFPGLGWVVSKFLISKCVITPLGGSSSGLRAPASPPYPDSRTWREQRPQLQTQPLWSVGRWLASSISIIPPSYFLQLNGLLTPRPNISHCGGYPLVRWRHRDISPLCQGLANRDAWQCWGKFSRHWRNWWSINVIRDLKDFLQQTFPNVLMLLDICHVLSNTSSHFAEWRMTESWKLSWFSQLKIKKKQENVLFLTQCGW